MDILIILILIFIIFLKIKIGFSNNVLNHITNILINESEYTNIPKIIIIPVILYLGYILYSTIITKTLCYLDYYFDISEHCINNKDIKKEINKSKILLNIGIFISILISIITTNLDNYYIIGVISITLIFLLISNEIMKIIWEYVRQGDIKVNLPPNII